MLPWKGTVPPRMDDETAVSSLGLAPTILTACGQRVPSQMQGINLLDGPGLKARPAVHGECYTHTMVDLENPVSSLRWRWMIEGFRKLILPYAPNEKGGPELYDLREDPDEQRNLASAQREEVERLRRIADGRWNP